MNKPPRNTETVKIEINPKIISYDVSNDFLISIEGFYD